jgi:hypothetical protein
MIRPFLYYSCTDVHIAPIHTLSEEINGRHALLFTCVGISCSKIRNSDSAETLPCAEAAACISISVVVQDDTADEESTFMATVHLCLNECKNEWSLHFCHFPTNRNVSVFRTAEGGILSIPLAVSTTSKKEEEEKVTIVERLSAKFGVILKNEELVNGEKKVSWHRLVAKVCHSEEKKKIMMTTSGCYFSSSTTTTQLNKIVPVDSEFQFLLRRIAASVDTTQPNNELLFVRQCVNTSMSFDSAIALAKNGEQGGGAIAELFWTCTHPEVESAIYSCINHRTKIITLDEVSALRQRLTPAYAIINALKWVHQHQQFPYFEQIILELQRETQTAVIDIFSSLKKVLSHQLLPVRLKVWSVVREVLTRSFFFQTAFADFEKRVTDFLATAKPSSHHNSTKEELELRFSNVTQRMFFNILEWMKKSPTPMTVEKSTTFTRSLGSQWDDPVERQTIVEWGSSSSKKNKRTEESITIVKRKIRVFDDSFGTGFRLVLSTETPQIASAAGEIANNNVKRERTRWSLLSSCKSVRVDATKIVTSSTASSSPSSSLEIEVEFLSFAEKTTTAIASLISFVAMHVWRIAHGSLNLYSSIRDQNKILAYCNRRIGGVESLKTAVDVNIFAKLRNLKRRDLTSRGIGSGYAVSLKADGVSAMLVVDPDGGIWLIRPPTDAILIAPPIDAQERRQMAGIVIAVEWCGISPHLQSPSSFFSSHIPLLVPFDLLSPPEVSGNNTPAHDHYMDRIQFANNAAIFISSVDPWARNFLSVCTKVVVPVGNTPETLASAICAVRKTESSLSLFKSDGLVFSPIHTCQNPHYDAFHRRQHVSSRHLPPAHKRRLDQFPDVVKYKPWDKLTLDCVVVGDDTKKTIRLVAAGGHLFLPVLLEEKEENQPSIASFENKDHPLITEAILTGCVLEISPVFDSKQEKILLRPLRCRHDKIFPNSISVLNDVWSLICNPLEDETVCGSTNMQLLRQHNNALKRQMWTRVLAADGEDCMARDTIVIDLGSGRGGDAHSIFARTAKTKCKRIVIFVEPNLKHIPELKRRISLATESSELLISNNYHILQTGAEDTDTICAALVRAFEDLKKYEASHHLPPPRVIVSAMLSLSFLWKDAETVNKLQHTLRTIGQISTVQFGSLPPVFMYFTLDGSRVKNAFSSLIHSSSSPSPPLLLCFGDHASIQWSPQERFFTTRFKNSLVIGDEQVEYFVNLDDLNSVVKFDENTRSSSVNDHAFLSRDELAFGNLFVVGTGQIISSAPP